MWFIRVFVMTFPSAISTIPIRITEIFPISTVCFAAPETAPLYAPYSMNACMTVNIAATDTPAMPSTFALDCAPARSFSSAVFCAFLSKYRIRSVQKSDRSSIMTGKISVSYLEPQRSILPAMS